MILPRGYVAIELTTEAGSTYYHDAIATLATPEGQQGRPWAGLVRDLARTHTEVPSPDENAAWARLFLLRTEGEGEIPTTPTLGIRVWLPGDDVPTLQADLGRTHGVRLVGVPYLRRFLAYLGEGIEPENEPAPAPEPEPATPVATEPEPEPEPGTDRVIIAVEPPQWTLLPDTQIDALEVDQVYGWIQSLERDYSVRPPWNCEFLPVEDLRTWLREAVRSDRVRAGWEQQQAEAEERERRVDLAFPSIQEYVEASIRGDVTLRISPFPGGYAIVARTGRGDQIYRHSAKTAPWRSDKIIIDTTAGIAEALARGGHGAEADARGWVSAAWDAIRDRIHNDPDAEIAVQSPVVKKALANLCEVRIQKGETTLTEVIYVVNGSRVSLEFDAKAYTGTAACLNERWYNVFAPDEISADKDDWAVIKRFWGSIAEITTVEEYSTWDGIVEKFQEHLQGIHVGKTLADLLVSGFAWYDEAGAELTAPRPEGVIWVPASVVQEFVDRQNGDLRSANALAKVLKSRGIMIEGTKKLQGRQSGERLGRRSWPIDPGFVNFRPEWADNGEGLV